MTTHLPPATHYDAVVVGARVAGSATAMLLARQGLRVLAIDKAEPGTDTLSTHALMRGAVAQLSRWGILDEVRDSGTPAITQTVFRYVDGADTDEIVIDITPDETVDALYAPRRTVLDPIMVEAARAGGVEVRHGTRMTDIVRTRSDRVAGLCIEGPTGTERITTDLLVGADGLRSSVARRLDVPVTRRGRHATGSIYKYLRGADLDHHRYLWLNHTDAVGGVIPTNDDLHLVFVSVPAERFGSWRHDVDASFWRTLAHIAPDIAAAASTGTQVGPSRSWPGHLGQFRQATGPGWALVGDAGYFKDPAGAHGMSDALRDAELLTDAVLDGDPGAYGPRRDELSAGFFDALEEVVSFDWTIDELKERHIRMARAMSGEYRSFTAQRVDRLAVVV